MPMDGILSGDNNSHIRYASSLTLCLLFAVSVFFFLLLFSTPIFFSYHLLLFFSYIKTFENWNKTMVCVQTTEPSTHVEGQFMDRTC